MTVETKRRDVIIGLSAIVGISAFPNTASAAYEGYLVMGPLGEYYFFSESELNAMTHRGQCKATECGLVSPPSVFVKKGNLNRFELKSAARIAPRIKDKSLIQGLDDSIKRRQALGSQMKAKLISEGFSIGTMNPTKAG